MAKIVKITDEIEMSKRFYLPGVVLEKECPNCKSKASIDLGSDYLNYPVTNKKEKVHLYCENCDKELSLEIILQIQVEIIE